ncbi:MAG: hypothetical protein H7Y17_15670 [Chlorobia bacterium]|nr:hypothetical protein [Fimbriimonadaceae bacterium]
MGILELYRNWVSAVVGRALTTGGVAGDSISVPRSRPRQQSQTNNLDPILLMDMNRDADLRLQQKFEQIRLEETNILNKIIGMD